MRQLTIVPARYYSQFSISKDRKLFFPTSHAITETALISPDAIACLNSTSVDDADYNSSLLVHILHNIAKRKMG